MAHSKGTTLKAAIADWEQKAGQKVTTSKEVKLIGFIPPIEKLDSAMSSLSHVEKLSLSTNCIEKMTNLTSLKHLKILSVGRNNIKTLAGLECLAETLEEIWISYNQIEKLVGIGALKKLKVFYMSNNLVKEWSEFQRLTELPLLEDLLFVGNPLEERHSLDGSWRREACKRVPNLKKLDGVPVVRDNEDEVILQFVRQESKDKEQQQK